MGDECETDLLEAIRRMRENDATLRALRIAWAFPPRYGRLVRFARALEQTRAPIADIALRNFPMLYTAYLRAALRRTRAPLRAFRLCNFRGTDFHLASLLSVLRRHHRGLRHVAVHSPWLSDDMMTALRGFFGVSATQEVLLHTIGQFAAAILRPLLAPTVHCAQSGECICEM
jgi:hypothetical protein